MSHARSMTGPPSAWRATALAVAALLFVSTSPAGNGQALPDFLSEARATAPQDVTVKRVQRWAQQAEDFLRESDAGSGAREDVYLQLLDWVELLSGDSASNELDEVIGAYFAEFPEGRFRDEFEWKRLRYSTNRDRFETPNDGATMVVSAARGYESYLASRPDTRMADEIKLIIGAEYHTASELIQYFPELNGAYSAREGVEFRTRGRNIWRNLLGSTDEEVALKAALYLSQQDVFFGSPPRRNNDNIRSGRGRAVIILLGPDGILESAQAFTISPGTPLGFQNVGGISYTLQFTYEGTVASHTHGGSWNANMPASITLPPGATFVANVGPFAGGLTLVIAPTSQVITWNIRVTGLELLSSSFSRWELFSNTYNLHPASHWVTAAVNTKLRDLTRSYNQSTDKIAWLNDESINWGGKLDINAAFGISGAHQKHKLGRSADGTVKLS